MVLSGVRTRAGGEAALLTPPLLPAVSVIVQTRL